MKKTEKTVTIYEVRDGFTVEVTRKDKGFYEFYLNHNEYSFKMFMFGCPVREDENVCATIEALIESNIDYIDFYQKEIF